MASVGQIWIFAPGRRLAASIAGMGAGVGAAGVTAFIGASPSCYGLHTAVPLVLLPALLGGLLAGTADRGTRSAVTSRVAWMAPVSFFLGMCLLSFLGHTDVIWFGDEFAALYPIVAIPAAACFTASLVMIVWLIRAIDEHPSHAIGAWRGVVLTLSIACALGTGAAGANPHRAWVAWPALAVLDASLILACLVTAVRDAALAWQLLRPVAGELWVTSHVAPVGARRVCLAGLFRSAPTCLLEVREIGAGAYRRGPFRQPSLWLEASPRDVGRALLGRVALLVVAVALLVVALTRLADVVPLAGDGRFAICL